MAKPKPNMASVVKQSKNKIFLDAIFCRENDILINLLEFRWRGKTM